jgi:dTDP-4-amino-4,6-dideoxygalactose transaminase
MTTAPTRTRPVPFVDLPAQLGGIAGDVDAAVRRVIDRADFILGEQVTLFEEEFAAYCGTAHAIGVDTGTSALELILRALGIGPGDEVVTVSNSFVATALAISYTGATPVLVDADERTSTMTAEAVAAVLTPRTRAVLPVHLYGQPADMDPILDLARRHGLAVVEDACQAHGARYKGRRAGSLGTAAAFSFYPSKNLGALGDGGAVVTSDAALAAEVRRLRAYGGVVKNQSITVGYNKRLDELQAAVLRVKLRHLDDWNAARAEHARSYDRQLGEVEGVRLPLVRPDADSVWHLYVVNVDRRDAVQRRLTSEGISTGVHYPIPIHRQPAYADLRYAPGSLPVSEAHSATCLSLPMYAELTPSMTEQVAEALRDAVAAER